MRGYCSARPRIAFSAQNILELKAVWLRCSLIEAQSRQDAALGGKRRQVLILSSTIFIYFLIVKPFIFCAGMADP
jgi:hypothetical protein